MKEPDDLIIPIKAILDDIQKAYTNHCHQKKPDNFIIARFISFGMCGKGKTMDFTQWMNEKADKDKKFDKFQAEEEERILKDMADGQYLAELRPFSWTSRSTNPQLDGVLRDMVAFWEVCNMKNANTLTNIVTINSPHSTF